MIEVISGTKLDLLEVLKEFEAGKKRVDSGIDDYMTSLHQYCYGVCTKYDNVLGHAVSAITCSGCFIATKFGQVIDNGSELRNLFHSTYDEIKGYYIKEGTPSEEKGQIIQRHLTALHNFLESELLEGAKRWEELFRARLPNPFSDEDYFLLHRLLVRFQDDAKKWKKDYDQLFNEPLV